MPGGVRGSYKKCQNALREWEGGSFINGPLYFVENSKLINKSF